MASSATCTNRGGDCLPSSSSRSPTWLKASRSWKGTGHSGVLQASRHKGAAATLSSLNVPYSVQQEHHHQTARALNSPASANASLINRTRPHPNSCRVPCSPLTSPTSHGQSRGVKCDATAFSGGQSDSAPEPRASASILEAVTLWLAALYKFSRPHTMLGTTVSILSISLLALEGASPTTAVWVAMLEALVSALLMNIAIVGINQLYDVEIDKVNKPYLPLASGELSIQQGRAIVGASAVGGLLIGVASGSMPLLCTLSVSLLLGVLYSTELPFMRWKRSPLLAAGCILIVRALIVQLGFFFHIKQTLGSVQLTVSAPVAFTLAFMLFFSVVIALFKDIPDTIGDVRAGVRTLSVRIGVERVFWICIWLLTAAYVGASAFCAVTCTTLPAKLGLAAGHAALCGLLWQRALRVQHTKPSDLTSCYMFIWKLFYAEYLLIPFLQ